jgi:hypothetical protein
LVPAGPVHEQGQRVGRAGGRPGFVDDFLGRSRSEDLDLEGIELSAKRCDPVFIEVVLNRERLDRGLVDLSTLLGFVQERLKRCFKQGAQFGSTPYVRMRGGARESALPRIRRNAGGSCGIPGPNSLTFPVSGRRLAQRRKDSVGSRQAWRRIRESGRCGRSPRVSEQGWSVRSEA